MNLIDLLPELADQTPPIVVASLNPIDGEASFFKPVRVMLTVDGQHSVTREITNGGKGVGVLLHDPHAQTVLLVEEPAAGANYHQRHNPQFRFAGLICGHVKPDEEPVAAVLREVKEETGLVSPTIRQNSISPIAPPMYVGGTITNGTMQLFYAQAELGDLQTRQLTDNPWRGETDQDGKNIEFVRPWVVPIDHFLQTALDVGKGPHSMTAVMAAQWLSRNLHLLVR
jgi:8-oxo-dGTP pyrophosphatase MutT (NUDIX family)